MFIESGALLEGHFLLSSGLHSPNYMQSALVLADPKRASLLGAALAKLAPLKPDLIVSPAMGGLIIGQEVARALDVRHYFAERDNGLMSFRRGFSITKGESVIVIEDVVTTGKSSKEVMTLVRAQGGRVTNLLSIVDRGAPDLGVPAKSLLTLIFPTYDPKDCPLCKSGTPAVKPGSRPSR
jgi:orotate phosphoribosyltransferase